MQHQTIYEHMNPDTSHTVIVGDDRDRIEDAFEKFANGRSISDTGIGSEGTPVVNTDGGVPRERRIPDASESEHSRQPIHRTSLDDSLDDKNAEKAVLAFREPDRGRFFHTLRACREHGTEVVIPTDQAQKVLVTDPLDEWVIIDVEPVPSRQRRLKRLFDIAFASIGLLALVPLIVIIALAIKLDSRGPVLYKQQRSGLFGQPFQCYKFRTMYTDSESAEPQDDTENDRITPVGHVLRKTHVDEIPQLWPILRGEMSVVGPRAAWVEEEEMLEDEVKEWRKRWFVKPGLTGLAQINEVSSTDAEVKLRYDLEYIRRQSLRLDVWIVAVQLRMVLSNLLELLNRIGRPNRFTSP